MLFITPSTSAFILAVYAARARRRSGKVALILSGLLLLATIDVRAADPGRTFLSAWQSGGWFNVAGIAVIAVVAVLVFAWARSRHNSPVAGPGRGGLRR